MGLIFNGVIEAGIITDSSKFYGLMSVPFWEHLLIGSILFGAVFMATDPVTAAQTNKILPINKCSQNGTLISP